MGNVGVTEILLIALVALLLFGAGRIADIGKGLGQGIKNFKQGLKEADELDADKADKRAPAGAPPPALGDGSKGDGERPAPKQA
ncbi:MAG TPA: twin-arginine translocase TatA/TatE family subunit [Polyangiaceae bacterium]|nr:twin-arginine translocase TatA/TatE family subunit [Polyangiaceae bacterium]